MELRHRQPVEAFGAVLGVVRTHGLAADDEVERIRSAFEGGRIAETLERLRVIEDRQPRLPDPESVSELAASAHRESWNDIRRLLETIEQAADHILLEVADDLPAVVARIPRSVRGEALRAEIEKAVADEFAYRLVLLVGADLDRVIEAQDAAVARFRAAVREQLGFIAGAGEGVDGPVPTSALIAVLLVPGEWLFADSHPGHIVMLSGGLAAAVAELLTTIAGMGDGQPHPAELEAAQRTLRDAWRRRRVAERLAADVVRVLEKRQWGGRVRPRDARTRGP